MEGVQIKWKNIHVEVKAGDKRAPILQDINGYANPGSLLAIMGSSGAGKTTFMNVLAQRNLRGLDVSGQITLNGVPISVDNIKKLSGYIQQDDVFIAAMTVRVKGFCTYVV